MDEISQRIKQIPYDLESVMEVLLTGTADEVKTYLPMFLGEIQGKIAACKER